MNSTATTPKHIKVRIPVIQYSFEENAETEAYLQALFDTADDIKTIKANLDKFSDNRDLWFYTPSQSYRADRPVRSFRLGFGDSGFGLFGDGWFDDSGGVSFGVLSRENPKGFSSLSQTMNKRHCESDSEPKART